VSSRLNWLSAEWKKFTIISNRVIPLRLIWINGVQAYFSLQLSVNQTTAALKRGGKVWKAFVRVDDPRCISTSLRRQPLKLRLIRFLPCSSNRSFPPPPAFVAWALIHHSSLHSDGWTDGCRRYDSDGHLHTGPSTSDHQVGPVQLGPCGRFWVSAVQDRLQSVFNAAARLVYSRRMSEHTTPLLQELHWLRVPERIQCGLCVLAYHYVHGTAPAYLADSLRLPSEPQRSLLVVIFVLSPDRRCWLPRISCCSAGIEQWHSPTTLYNIFTILLHVLFLKLLISPAI